MAKSKRHVTASELNMLIELAPTLTPDSYTLRNALMELRGLRAVHARCEPARYGARGGNTYLIYDKNDDEWQNHA